MSNEKQETIEDIVREMRSLGRLDERSTDKIPRSLQALGLRTYADRIDAAWKRERERGAEAAQICGEIGEAIGRGSSGNAAKMREALSDACYAMHNFLKTQYGGYEEMAKALDKAKAALSAPPRNCDIYDAESCRMAYHLHGDGLMTMQAFADWLFDTVEEGATNEQK